MLDNRGINYKDCEVQLSNMLNPMGLYGIVDATEVVIHSLREQQTIAMAGDYDVDGATGVALGIEALGSFGAKKVIPLLPDRFSDGYGLSENMVEEAQARGVNLLITVDNGIAAHSAIRLAREYKINVIITDHHLPGEELPPANAIINPNIPDCSFASKHLAGVGVVFYLMCAVRTALREQKWFLFQKIPEPSMSCLLDYVALGTIADMTSIDNNNRLLIKSGITRIRAGNAHKGIVALLEAMQVDPSHVTPRDLGFAVAPPLNAAGRLAHMDKALACLMATSWAEARNSAAELVAHNTQRKQIQLQMYQEALELATAQQQEQGEDCALVLFNPDWHQGLTGLVAGMIRDRLNKSCFVLTQAKDMLVGSARSVNGDHLLRWLDQVHSSNQNLLARFGGHAMAAGFSLYPNALADFRRAISSCEVQNYTTEALTEPDDGELPVAEITLKNALLLENLTPWGRGCEEPLFYSLLTLTESRVVGVNHLQLKFIAYTDKGQKDINAVAFFHNEEDLPHSLPAQLKVYYHLSANHFRNSLSLQLVVKKLLLPDGQGVSKAATKGLEQNTGEVEMPAKL